MIRNEKKMNENEIILEDKGKYNLHCLSILVRRSCSNCYVISGLFKRKISAFKSLVMHVFAQIQT